MFLYLIKILIVVLIISIERDVAELEGYHKFVYQMDMSEHCRRRVIPSVFLGRQVVGANSQILQFSQMEVPYSCSVTVRTEMGSNIIVVIQVVSDVDLNETCKKHKKQLVIYEISETFRGYWAQLPDSVMQSKKRRKDRTYTLEQPKTEPETTTTTRTTTKETTTASQPVARVEENKEYLTVEIPIVNVSYRLQAVKTKPTARSTTERYKLLQYLKGEEIDKYSSEHQSTASVHESVGQNGDDGILVLQNSEDGTDPIVVLENASQNADESDGFLENKDFQVLVENLFAADRRLTTLVNSTLTKTKKSHKYYPTVNRRFNFKKSRQLFSPKDGLFSEKFPFTKRLSLLSTLRNNYYLSKTTKMLSSTKKEQEIKHQVNPWDVIHILKNLSSSEDTTTQPPHKELADILRRISDKKLNTSVYLAPHLFNTEFTTLGTITTKRKIDGKTTTGGFSSYKSTYLHEPNVPSKRTSTSQASNKSFNEFNGLRGNDSVNNDSNDHRASLALLPLAIDLDTIVLNVTNQKKSAQDNSPQPVFEGATTTTKKPDLLTVSLVDHESWDNVVKSAGVMADKLNQTNLTADGYGKEKANAMNTKPRISYKLKKRSMKPIDIVYKAHPHHVLNNHRKHNITTNAPEKFDRLEFQSLIELQHDEIHGRVAMKNLDQFVDLPLLDLCDFNVTAGRRVYLLNSSRLVLSLTNFTLKRVTVVLTPARTLLNSDAHCRDTYLECQVSGARVCIDSLSACDGVPNCGSYDIYDEDRLRCGAEVGLRHNVYLAAMTFLAVLLTMVYSIHYWLKRCVPRVSEAFFIYTDAAENVLYLNTIMRSPHDIGVGTHGSHLMLQEFMDSKETEIKESAWRRIWHKAFGFLRCRPKKQTPKKDKLEPQHLSATFTEMEIRKLQTPGVDIAVQTDSSIHISPLDSRLSLHRMASITSDVDSNPPLDELSMLKYFRSSRVRSVSGNLSSNFDFKERLKQLNNQRQSKEEEVIQSHSYSSDIDSIEQTVTPLIHNSEIANVEPNAKLRDKHLRFHDDATIILDEEDGDKVVEKSSNSRRSVLFAPGKVSLVDHDDDELVQQSSSAREFKSYFNWGGSKDKKKKSKKK